MKKIEKLDTLNECLGGEHWGVCTLYTAATLFTLVYVPYGGIALAGFTAACWATV
jgi:hypothetical protein